MSFALEFADEFLGLKSLICQLEEQFRVLEQTDAISASNALNKFLDEKIDTYEGLILLLRFLEALERKKELATLLTSSIPQKRDVALKILDLGSKVSE